MPDSVRLYWCLFHGLNGLSTCLTLLLGIVYILERQNILVVSVCVVHVLGSLVLGSSSLAMEGGGTHLRKPVFCLAQSLILSYWGLSVFMHLALLMVSQCVAALGLRLFGVRNPKAWPPLFVVLAWTLPLVALLIVESLGLATEHDDIGLAIGRENIDYWDSLIGPHKQIRQRCFHCTSAAWDRWLGYRAMLLPFGVLGCVSAAYLLWQTVASRQGSLRRFQTSQISGTQVMRLAIATVCYIVGVLVTVFGGATEAPTQSPPPGDLFAIVPDIFNPLLNRGFCSAGSADDSLHAVYYRAALCPTSESLQSTVLGIMIFFMYGLGSVSMAFYRRLWNGLFAVHDGGSARKRTVSIESTSTTSIALSQRQRQGQGQGQRHSSLSSLPRTQSTTSRRHPAIPELSDDSDSRDRRNGRDDAISNSRKDRKDNTTSSNRNGNTANNSSSSSSEEDLDLNLNLDLDLEHK